MFRDAHKYIQAYLKIADLHRGFLVLSLITAIVYKAAAIARKYVAAMIVGALIVKDSDQTYFYIILYIITYFIHRFSLFINYRIYSWSVEHSYASLQDRVFQKIIYADVDFIRQIDKGRLMNTINADLLSIGEMSDEIAEYLTTILQLITILVIVGSYSIPAVILMMISIAIYCVVRTQSDRKYNFFWWRSQIQNDRYSNFLGQVLSGLQEVKTFNMMSSLKKRLDGIQKRYDKSYFSQRHYYTIRDNDVNFFYYFIHSLLFVALILAVSWGHLAVDILVLIISYHEVVLSCTKDLTDATIEIRLTNAAVRRVSAILNYRPHEKYEFGDLSIDNLHGSIAFRNVSLSLNRRRILKDLNFKIKPREFVAIVGFPGSGKTKLFDLILRLYQPTKGKILLDDININDFSRAVYTSNVAVANQTPFIFNTSIRKNLSFVDPDISHQINACKIAGIHDFIETLPQGYNTILRENATNISGGQRQMISIARTILTDAEILLLDDVTTALDPDTAALVPRLIKKLKDKRTIIMITKKPDLMKTADRIIVLDHGRISDIGTHEKLLARNKVYRSLQALSSDLEEQK